MNKVILHKRIFGFTLAEVLITLGIIGIVASITVPIIVANTQKQQYVIGLKKGYSTVQQGIKAIMAEEGVSDFGQTSLFDGNNFDNTTRLSKVDATIKKHFKVVKSCKASGDPENCVGVSQARLLSNNGAYNYLYNNYIFQLADGGYLGFYLYSTCPSTNIANIKRCGVIEIDINGSKKPNQIGKDDYTFLIGNNGIIYPYGGESYAKMYCTGDWKTCSRYWQNHDLYYGCPNKENYSMDLGNPASIGLGCAARIMEEGWEMNY